MALVMEVGLDQGHIVLHGDPVPPPKRHSPQFLAHVCPRRPHCIRRVPSAPRKGHSAPPLRPMSIVATVAHISYCWAL